ncbi:MAG: hypothetical protein JSV19_01420 [Phycisphaerales bacterium]|nr:MAG: hypothetical protein JSV19_01420 [Phycisphaerales bacterium]
MTNNHWLELPGHVVAKIEQVLGIPPSELPKHDFVSLIEELCDTVLMYDREERGAAASQPAKPLGETEGIPTSQPGGQNDP